MIIPFSKELYTAQAIAPESPAPNIRLFTTICAHEYGNSSIEAFLIFIERCHAHSTKHADHEASEETLLRQSYGLRSMYCNTQALIKKSHLPRRTNTKQLMALIEELATLEKFFDVILGQTSSLTTRDENTVRRLRIFKETVSKHLRSLRSPHTVEV